jgi:hypothetical protein
MADRTSSSATTATTPVTRVRKVPDPGNNQDLRVLIGLVWLAVSAVLGMRATMCSATPDLPDNSVNLGDVRGMFRCSGAYTGLCISTGSTAAGGLSV